MLLELNGHSVSVCYNRQAGLKVARKALVTVMILDIGMSDWTGYEVARRVRAERFGHRRLFDSRHRMGAGRRQGASDRGGLRSVDPVDVESLLQTLSTTNA